MMRQRYAGGGRISWVRVAWRKRRQTAAGRTTGVAWRTADAEIVDVWSRTQPKYRVRALSLLLLNLALFCGLCVFTFWLREARYFDFSWDSYVAPAIFWKAGGPSLNDFLYEPISVERVPAHAVVLGLLMGSITGVPIAVAILYRFGCALPFLAAVLVFAHMPWMVVTLAASCALATLPPFRMKFRFASGLLGLLPVLLYLLLARGGEESAGAASPAQRTLLAFPWVLAILAAAAMIGLVLQIARLVRYRPGAIAPVLAAMFVAPVAVFHLRVGVDELDYRVLEKRYGPRSAAFEPVRDVRPIVQDLIRRLAESPALFARYEPQLLAALRGERPPDPRLLLNYIRVEFLSERAAAYEACRRFIADHPRSPYVPCVLYLQARALDTRLDEREMRRAPARRALYSDFPHVQSEPVWLSLLNQFPASPFAAVASLRIAQLRLRRGEVDEAQRLLEQVLRVPLPQAGQEPPAPYSAEADLGYEPQPFLRQARRLLELIRANGNDPRYGTAPLRELAALDPHRITYPEQLLRLIDRYPDALLRDNLLVAYAAAQETPEQQEQILRNLLPRLPAGGDALPEAMFRLANLELRGGPGEDVRRRQQGLSRLRAVVQQYAQHYWAEEAGELLRLYEPRTPG